MDLGELWHGTSGWLNSLPWWAIVLATLVVYRLLKINRVEKYAGFGTQFPEGNFSASEQRFSTSSHDANGTYVVTQSGDGASPLLSGLKLNSGVHAQEFKLDEASAIKLKELIQNGQMIAAVKFVRGLMGNPDLTTAKNLVDNVKKGGQF